MNITNFRDKLRGGRRESADSGGSYGSPGSPGTLDDDMADLRISGLRRESTQASAMSEMGTVSLSRSRDRKNEPLGLHVVYKPPGPRNVDIIFVHGLGGTSRLSWSYDRNLNNFWPKEWLPLEPGFKDSRVLTFGYNANFMAQNKDMFNISNFAHDLLLQLKVGQTEDVESLEIGQVPIIFVVHSMGGLVVKKAYILGAQDKQYSHILDTVRSIVFLATPHRGANLAEMLNKFLVATFQSPKQYISDQQRNSARISDINDQFRLHAEKLDLVSFFETLPTSIGVKKMFIVDPDSATTGYPHEMAAPLNADHHHVSKFISRRDGNYIIVRNVVKSLIDKFKVPVRPRHRRSMEDTDSTRSLPNTVTELMTRLGVEPRPSEMLSSVMEQYVPGCCDWVLSNLEFANFVADTSLQPSILHVTGAPGTGKTVMASFLVQHLEGRLGFATQFWYFRYDSQTRRSNRQCLLSLAFQIMSSLPAYAHKLLSRKAADIDSIARSDLRTLWQKLFLDVLDTLNTSAEPLYWVVDALDESESAQAFLQLLMQLKSMRFPLRVILLSRIHAVTKHVDRLRSVLPPGRVSQLVLAAPTTSLQLYIGNMMDSSPWDDEDLKAQITRDLLHKSQGSFLWLSLVMRDLAYCDTADQVMETLRDIPYELTAVYERLEQLVSHDLRPSDASLVTAILSWVACAERPLDEEELREALKPRFPLLSVRHTISRLCGDFVVVDKKGSIAMVHHTAREFLTAGATSLLRVHSEDAHALILDKCLATLIDPRFKLRLKSQGCTGLLRYCCLSWAHHLARSDVLDGPRRDSYVDTIKRLFAGPAVLAWIEAVATAQQLHVLTATSRTLLLFAERLRQATAHENPVARPLGDIEFLSSWATELVRIVGKFGTHLLQCPPAIYALVPLFCPPDSVICRQFAQASSSYTSAFSPAYASSSTSPPPYPPYPSPMAHQTIDTTPRITGIASTGWDDSLAKFTLGPDERPEMVYGLDSSFGILTSDKSVNLYDAATFQELHRFRHGETIVVAEFSRQGTLLVTCGIRTVKVWDTTSGRLLHSFPNPRAAKGGIRRGMRAQAVAFSHDATEIILFCVDSTIRRRRLAEPEPESAPEEHYGYGGGGGDGSSAYQIESGHGGDDGWMLMELHAPDESAAIVNARGSPLCVSFSRDGSKVALSYRVTQTSVWDTVTGNRIGKCEPRGGYTFTLSKRFDHPTRLQWNPITEHVVGIYLNGTVFKWDPMEREAEEMENHADVLATDLACSADGRLIVTAQRDGSLKVFSFESFTLLFNLTSMMRPTAMAFSPDGRRIYDLRRSFCNVWQPNALIRVAEQDERNSDAASSHYETSVTGSVISEANAVLLEPVTAVAASAGPGSIAYAFGNDGGSLRYYADDYMAGILGSSTSTGGSPPADITCGMLGVTCIAFSSDGAMLATASIDNKVTVRRLLPDRSGLDMHYAFELEAVGSVLQTVLDGGGELLLVHTRDATRIWSVAAQQLVYQQAHHGESCRWLVHPTATRTFVAVRPSAVSTLYVPASDSPGTESALLLSLNISYQLLDSVDWSDVAPSLSRKLHQLFDSPNSIANKSSSPSSSSSSADMAVHKVFVTPGSTDLLLQMSGLSAQADRREARFMLLDASFLASPSAYAGATLYPRSLPEPVLSLIEVPLGFMAETADQARRGSMQSTVSSPGAGTGAGTGTGTGSGGDGNACAVLAFIDRDFWVRTWSLDDADGHSCKRHFFLPRDWVNMDCLDLAMVTVDGRFLCPRNGEVAVVHNGLWGALEMSEATIR